MVTILAPHSPHPSGHRLRAIMTWSVREELFFVSVNGAGYGFLFRLAERICSLYLVKF
jgi:hypothetical protein